VARSNPCTDVGATECGGDTMRERVDTGACLTWHSSDCTQLPAGGCVDTGSAACEACVNEPCEIGDKRCGVDDALETCQADSLGCGGWTGLSDCGAVAGGLGSCDDSGTAQCVDPCAGVLNTCATDGNERCNPTS